MLKEQPDLRRPEEIAPAAAPKPEIGLSLLRERFVTRCTFKDNEGQKQSGAFVSVESTYLSLMANLCPAARESVSTKCQCGTDCVLHRDTLDVEKQTQQGSFTNVESK